MSIVTERPTDPLAPHYFCPVCRTAFTTAQEARECAEQPLPEVINGIRVGSFVRVAEGYTWADDPSWIAGPSKRQNKNFPPQHDFLFLVTALTHDVHGHHRDSPHAWFNDNRAVHRPIFHIVTGGANIYTDGPLKGFRHVWTPATEHRELRLVKDAPRELYERAKHLLGQTSRSLL